MWPVIPRSTTLEIIVVLFLVVIVSTRIVQPAFWRSRGFRVATLVAFGAMLAGVGVWSIGRGLGDLRLVHAGVGVAYVGILVLTPAVAVLPISAVIDRGLMWATAHRRGAPAPEPEPKAGVSRRAVIRFGTSSLPTMAAFTGASGFVTAKLAPQLPIVRMRFPDLHPDLDGFRILQLSDLHLGVEMRLDDLEAHLRRAIAERKPDLVVLTGDLADVNELVPEALRIVHSMRPRHGVLASLGNHEYLHGIEVTRPMYESSPVPLLVSGGRTLRVGRARLWVGGADDPVHMGGDIAWMLRPSIEAAAAKAPRDADFKLLLCHRPEGFGPASELGFDLTLSGHTHGGQVGFMGKSLLEKLRPNVPWWGAYARRREASNGRPAGQSRLYTTSGMGHWFPFRLGCPTEMPLVVLERG
jgi:hypothetical protein